MRGEDPTLRTVHRHPPWNRVPRVVERLDEERLETLRAWGAGLSTNARDELRAAGKAILMLVDEIDRLEADLWNARAATKQAEAEAAAAIGRRSSGGRRRASGRRRAGAGRSGRGAGVHRRRLSPPRARLHPSARATPLAHGRAVAGARADAQRANRTRAPAVVRDRLARRLRTLFG